MSSYQNAYVINAIDSMTNNLPLYAKKQDQPLLAIDYDLHQFSFEAPQKTCVQGQLLSLHGALYIKGIEENFFATGTVTQVTPLDASSAKYTVALYRHNTFLWAKFRQTLEAEQEVVDQLFRSMRDEE